MKLTDKTPAESFPWKSSKGDIYLALAASLFGLVTMRLAALIVSFWQSNDLP